jgi:hypothetical protein
MCSCMDALETFDLDFGMDLFRIVTQTVARSSPAVREYQFSMLLKVISTGANIPFALIQNLLEAVKPFVQQEWSEDLPSALSMLAIISTLPVTIIANNLDEQNWNYLGMVIWDLVEQLKTAVVRKTLLR